MIIAICGLIGSGKDTIADHLVNVHQYRRESFANTLKDCVAAVFGWDRVMLEGRTRESREWREEVDTWWAERLEMPHLTPRWVLQNWGTEVCRKGFHDDIWVASLENKLRKMTDDIVISDCRFPNEIAAIRAQGGKVIRVERGNKPVWYDWAAKFNKANEEDQLRMRIVADLQESHFKYRIHPSEWAWAGTEFDCVIDNNYSIDELYKEVNNLAISLREPNSNLPI